MISKYNEFILNKQFENILLGDLLNESNEMKKISDNEVVWDFSKDKKANFVNKKRLNKMKNFLKDFTKKEVKIYFHKFLSIMKKFPIKTRKKLLLTYSTVFLSLVSFNYLTSDEDVKIDKDYEKMKTEFIHTINNLDDIEPVYTSPKKETKKDVLLNRKPSFEKAQHIVKEVEKGYSDDRGDTGNFINTPYGKRFIGTNHGISAVSLYEYLGKLPTKEDMVDLSYKTALKIYKNKYWDKQNLSDFNDQNIANIIYDATVNQGINGTKKILRKVYNNNGIEISNNQNPFDKKFIEEVNKSDRKSIFNDIKIYREIRYRNSRTFHRHGDGWLARVDSFEYENNT